MANMRLAVTGRHGQIVRSLMERAPAHSCEVLRLARPDVDLARPESVLPAMLATKPDVIIGAAAYTAVDAAESDRDAAFAINERGAGAVAAAALELRVPIIHLSTDYVFDGFADRPYREDDPAQPLGVYGASKLAGERAVASANADHVVLRTAWIYSPFGKNFMRTMLNLARQRDEISVVADQQGTPGNALDLADGIISVAKNLRDSPNESKLRGVFHMAAAGATTWAGFAEAIFSAARSCGGPSAAVKHIATSQFPTPARRPANSRLDTTRLASIHRITLPHWRDSLPACVERVVKEGVS